MPWPPIFSFRYRVQRTAARVVAAMALLVAAGGLGESSRASAEMEIVNATPRDARWEKIARNRGAQQIDQHRGGILVIGDSIAWRWPVKMQQEYFGRPFVNLGISGDQIENTLWRLPLYDLAAANPSAIVVILGTNNLRREDGISVSRKLQAFISEVKSKASGVPVFVSEVLPRGKKLHFKPADIAVVNANLAKNARSGGYSLLRTHEAFVAECDDELHCHLLEDFVHPNDDGYRVLGRVLKDALEG